MSDGVSFEAIKLFVLYVFVIFVWLWYTKKLFTRDYATFMAAVFATPFVMQLVYSSIPQEWHN